MASHTLLCKCYRVSRRVIPLFELGVSNMKYKIKRGWVYISYTTLVAKPVTCNIFFWSNLGLSQSKYMSHQCPYLQKGNNDDAYRNRKCDHICIKTSTTCVIQLINMYVDSIKALHMRANL